MNRARQHSTKRAVVGIELIVLFMLANSGMKTKLADVLAAGDGKNDSAGSKGCTGEVTAGE